MMLPPRQDHRVLAVLTGRVRQRIDSQGEWESAVEKLPLSCPATITRLGLEGDEQADRKHHGGPDKALLAWAAGHYPRWSDWLGRTLAMGFFGENLLLEGLDEERTCLGDRWAFCPAGHPEDEDPPVAAPVLEVSQPRVPCYKPGRLLGQADMAARMAEWSHTGCYLRVLVAGQVAAGAQPLLLQRPHPDWSVARCWKAYACRDTHPQEWQTLRRLPELAEAWRV